MGASEPLSCGEVTHKGHGGAEPGGWVSHVFQGRGLLHGSPSPPPHHLPVVTCTRGAPRKRENEVRSPPPSLALAAVGPPHPGVQSPLAT